MTTSSQPDVAPEPLAEDRPPARGIYAPTVAVSVIGLAVAVLILVVHVGRLTVDPVVVTPWAMLGVGLVLVGSGALAILRRPR